MLSADLRALASELRIDASPARIERFAAVLDAMADEAGDREQGVVPFGWRAPMAPALRPQPHGLAAVAQAG